MQARKSLSGEGTPCSGTEGRLMPRTSCDLMQDGTCCRRALSRRLGARESHANVEVWQDGVAREGEAGLSGCDSNHCNHMLCSCKWGSEALTKR